jgi:hypothetical protein
MSPGWALSLPSLCIPGLFFLCPPGKGGILSEGCWPFPLLYLFSAAGIHLLPPAVCPLSSNVLHFPFTNMCSRGTPGKESEWSLFILSAFQHCSFCIKQPQKILRKEKISYFHLEKSIKVGKKPNHLSRLLSHYINIDCPGSCFFRTWKRIGQLMASLVRGP